MQSYPPPPPRIAVCGVPVAYVHIVDGMPFVNALRRTLRLRFAPLGEGERFTLSDGTRVIAYLDVRRDATQTVVEVRNAAASPSDPATAIVLDTQGCRFAAPPQTTLTDKP